MIGETVSFKHNDKTIQGIVYMHNPLKGIIKVRALRPWVLMQGEPQYATYTVGLEDPSLMVLTVDREAGAKLERDYARKAKDTESH